MYVNVVDNIQERVSEKEIIVKERGIKGIPTPGLEPGSPR